MTAKHCKSFRKYVDTVDVDDDIDVSVDVDVDVRIRLQSQFQGAINWLAGDWIAGK